MAQRPDVAIIGAGPYGLSIATHVAAVGCRVRIFGKPLSTWSDSMPRGMLLKSDGFASNLSTPDGRGTLAEYCARNCISYHDTRQPVSLETFVDYGVDFQSRYVPYLEHEDVIGVEHRNGQFLLRIDSGESAYVDRIVLAVGITHFRRMPEMLANQPRYLVSHSADHCRFDSFAGRDVAVIGGGASAVDLAASLIDASARPILITRREYLKFGTRPTHDRPPWWQKLRHPRSALGPGWRSRMSSDLPWLFRYLPASLRLYLVRRHLGPASAWHMRDRIRGQVEVFTQQRLRRVRVHNGKVELATTNDLGETRELVVDHVIVATGYWPQVERMTFLSAELRSRMRHDSGMPRLSRNFETSIPGLYVTGLASAGSFGPLMRFVAGADFTARQISRHLARQEIGRRSLDHSSKAGAVG